MLRYSYALGDEAIAKFASLPARERNRLIRAFDFLAQFPAQPGDYRETGQSGRVYEVRLVGELLITWWTDHAAREVRVIRIESVD